MYLYFFPLVAALLGYLANLAFTGYLFGKIIPAKMPLIASAAGRYASGQLLNMDVIAARLTDPNSLSEMRPFIEQHIDTFLKVKLKEKMPAIAMFVGDKTLDSMKGNLMEEIDILLPNLLQRYAGNLGQKINIEHALVSKINELPVSELLSKHLKKEKMLFQLFGAATGLIIGVVLGLLSLVG
ncbi:MAG: hypothetical protein EOP49_24695 [Sphingobacteriales bacterium]|nr:MAG: hypothetical protein EOP49_24695 [Sphingobacteriales bacterium]